MDEEIKQNPIPVTPSCLCFKKDEFTQENFCVDRFISEHKKNVQLEYLRDDLNVYLNVLKSAMIELINKDYADFVNLSSNLVGLDKAIGNLSTPLGQLREEVMSVKLAVDNAITSASEKLVKRQRLREKKVNVQRIISIYQRIGQIESTLNIQKSKSPAASTDLQLTGEQIERMAIEIHQLNFDLSKSGGFPIVEQLRPRIDHVTSILQQSLEDLFLESIEYSADTTSLCRCLRIYAAIDKISDVEILVRQKIIQPFLSEIITEKHLKSEGLKEIYNEVLNSIPKTCGNLCDVTSFGRNNEIVPDYDFLTNSVWPEVVSLLENKIPSMFAPGNPNMFHDKYTISVDFLLQFEQQFSSIAAVNQFRSHPSYTTFLSKWNLPVYFQIRYQEIASALELSLQRTNLKQCSEDTFKLKVTQTLWNCLSICWSRDIFLLPLASRFWKLSLELLSRFNVWLESIISVQRKVLINQSKDEDNEYFGVNSTSIKSISDTNTEKKAPEGLSLQEIVLLVCDIDLVSFKLHNFYENSIKSKLMVLQVKSLPEFQTSFTDMINKISSHPQFLEDFLMSRVVLECKSHLKMVNDIPRLYRRTNKEIPTKPSGYVTNVLKPLQMFLNDHKDTLLSSESVIRRISLWKINVLEKVTEQYLSITSDVLTSVKKTEDSLKRLKKARERPSSAVIGGQNASNNSMTDDDKIRHQLFLDVEHYGQQITLFEVEISSIRSYINIVELVESARTTPEKC
ncbi:Conserved oligomeric Golgi complex subunit 2 [Nymphon striatum]|nr:Conserved oligomeric Golgi complex subunit 2 [Nymphon striatum]